MGVNSFRHVNPFPPHAKKAFTWVYMLLHAVYTFLHVNKVYMVKACSLHVDGFTWWNAGFHHVNPVCMVEAFAPCKRFVVVCRVACAVCCVLFVVLFYMVECLGYSLS